MKPRGLLVFLLLAAAAMACNLPTADALTPTPTPGAETSVALTVAARQQGTLTAAPSLTSTGDAFPTFTVPALFTPTAPATTRQASTATAQPCDEASFIQDVTIADGTKLSPSQAFTKTWRLRNIGTCTWTPEYAVVFISGEAMGAPAVVKLTGEVPPNDLVDISIEMKAPASTGKYTGYWKMRSPSGGQFGVSGNNSPFYVQIDVVIPTPGGTRPVVTATPTRRPAGSTTPTPGEGLVLYSFADQLCEAEWRSQSGVLECPGIQGDAWGFALRPTAPRLEDGSTAGDRALLTVPDTSANGAITGKFPAQPIQQGERFRAQLGCVEGARGCDVVFQLNFIIASGPASNLGQWRHTYRGSLESVDVDLSSLAGQNVQIILAVLANGSAADDQAVWVNPRLVKP
jgi:hypothetical protein